MLEPLVSADSQIIPCACKDLIGVPFFVVGFAVKHLPPFNDKACDYLRAVGPGVLVGQAWVEGRKLEQFPRQLFGEFMMVQKFC